MKRDCLGWQHTTLWINSQTFLSISYWKSGALAPFHQWKVSKTSHQGNSSVVCLWVVSWPALFASVDCAVVTFIKENYSFGIVSYRFGINLHVSSTLLDKFHQKKKMKLGNGRMKLLYSSIWPAYLWLRWQWPFCFNYAYVEHLGITYPYEKLLPNLRELAVVFWANETNYL